MRILLFSTLYPNARVPRHGIFVENRMRKYLEKYPCEVVVVAPVPWLPGILSRMERYSQYRNIPPVEVRNGITVYHPRYPVIPRLGMLVTPWLMRLAVQGLVRRLHRETGGFDFIDAHYMYPDGIAASGLARTLGCPLLITARGTDVNLVFAQTLPRRLIRSSANYARKVITVCAALRDTLVSGGVPDSKVSVLRNGVDLDMFVPLDREAQRTNLGLQRRTLLSVGHLVERKGHHLVIEALRELPDTDLVIAGDGEERNSLQVLAHRLGLESRVRFIGAVPHEEMKSWYSACDALVLASSREGWANVLLESMACGTPVVATSIWGTPEVVQSPEAGVLAEARSAESIATAVRKLFDNYPSHRDTRKYAEQFSWNETVEKMHVLFTEAATGESVL